MQHSKNFTIFSKQMYVRKEFTRQSKLVHPVVVVPHLVDQQSPQICINTTHVFNQNLPNVIFYTQIQQKQITCYYMQN